jgi:hypothetical protein
MEKQWSEFEFREELCVLLNKHNMQKGSKTPDWILSTFLTSCMFAFDHATRERDKWDSIEKHSGINFMLK